MAAALSAAAAAAAAALSCGAVCGAAGSSGGSRATYDGRPKRVMVTGCSGSIGRPVCTWLAGRGHTVVGFDAVASPSLSGVCHEVICGDICDYDAVSAAMVGVDVLIHLAAYPDIKDPATGKLADFVGKLMLPNVQGLYVCAEAALQAGIKRVVLASSVQVVTGLTATADVDERPKPNLPALGGSGRFLTKMDGVAPLHEYAMTKVWAETLGEMCESRPQPSLSQLPSPRIPFFVVTQRTHEHTAARRHPRSH